MDTGMSIITAFLRLPQVVTAKDAETGAVREFWLQLFPDVNEARLCYGLGSAADTWANPFYDGRLYYCSFLWLCQGIETDAELLQAINDLYDWLQARIAAGDVVRASGTSES